MEPVFCFRCRKFLYLCIKSQDPMVRTFTLLALDDNDVTAQSDDDVRECWFKFSEER